ncbi:MAG TPA: DUF4270 family protein, partial [Bacteroidaceae bacterium]|nr:DUF4270 family protein [Bacteroidaceae bacterium]
MKSMLWDHLLKFRFPFFLLLALIVLGGYACRTDENELGRDLLPPGDNIFVFYDALDDILTYPVARIPYSISENRYNPQSTRLFLLGNKRDTLSGFSKADIVTQFNPTSGFVFGPNMRVDSVVLYLYFNESIADIIKPVNIKVYELTERIYMDSVYYTDFDITGKISPEPIAEKKIIPADSTVFEFVIESAEFINKFINPPNDTLFYSDSLFKDYFNGLYITSEDLPEGGFFSKVHLSNNNTKLSIKYANDSTAIDTLPGYNYVWRTFSINEYSSQKINIFKHDFSGTTFETILNNPDSKSP